MSRQASNKNLKKASKNKNDEFYTQLVDIERELKYYKAHFRDKVVYCNCDDPRVSNFFKYFYLNFEYLGLKKLIATCYKNQDIDLFSMNDKEEAVWLEYNGNGNIDDFDNVEVNNLKGDGDFRSEECIELLKQADVVVTNPPFSLFREYIGQLVEYDKKFLVIGNINCLTYKEIFPLIAQNKLWLGYHSGDMEFQVPDYYEPRKTRFRIDENGIKWRSMGNICWFTNLDIEKRHENITLYKTYNEEEYPKYDNYDAINVNKVADIPVDYDGVMGVPITFFNKYNPDQFEIVTFRKGNDGKDLVYSLTNSLDKEIDMKDNALASRQQASKQASKQASTTILQSSRTKNLETNSQETREQPSMENCYMQEYLSATSIPGMIKNAEGKIGGKITYARVTIRRKRNEF